jgi:hypothetical protein
LNDLVAMMRSDAWLPLCRVVPAPLFADLDGGNGKGEH